LCISKLGLDFAILQSLWPVDAGHTPNFNWHEANTKMRYLSWTFRAIWVYFLLWVLYMWLCTPVVALHYSAKATEPIGFYLDTESSNLKRDLAPGESRWYATDMNRPPYMWVTVSFPFHSKDFLNFEGPFSRIDVYIGPGAQIERTEIRHGFFARFTNPDLHDDWRD